jgi:hypothetical protein
MAKNKKTAKKQPKLKHAARKKAALKPHAAKKKAASKKATRRRTVRRKRRVRGKSQSVTLVARERQGLGARSGGQSGDLQGLPSIAGADAESVEELIEEGNALEAEIVKGVQDAENADEAEVVTHEVPEDDVPKEYFDH